MKHVSRWHSIDAILKGLKDKTKSKCFFKQVACGINVCLENKVNLQQAAMSKKTNGEKN